MASDRNRPAPPSERSFGILFGSVLAALAAWLGWHGRTPPALACAALAAVLVVLALLAPRALAWPNRAWFALGMLMHRIVSPVVLGAIYFLVVTPIAFAMRLAGRDPLDRRREAAKASYWKDRVPPGPKPDSFRNQF